MTKNLIIAGCILVIGILLALLFRPAPKPILPDKSIVDTLRSELARERAHISTISEKLGKDTLENNKRISALEHENRTLRKRQATLRPQVQVIADTSAILNEFLTVQDLIQDADSAMIANYAVEVAELRDVAAQMIRSDEVKNRIHNELISHKDATIEVLKQDNKKLRRKLVWTKIGGVILLGGIVTLLSQ